jgi:nucleoside-diphosphate-sugar epimerase
MKQLPRKPTVLLVGASGFVGQSVFRWLAANGDANLRVLTRPTTTTLLNYQASIYVGDITDFATLGAAMAGADVIVNAASYTGSDPLKATQVNLEGTRNLLEAASLAGVREFVQVSTTSVYGTGPHRGETEAALRCAPESVVSSTRASAEQLVLDAGGTVIRAGLTYGAGDKWFIPSLIRMATILGGPVGDGASKLSVIDVEHLGSLIAGMLSADILSAGIGPGPFHAAEPVPVSVGQILRHIEDHVTGPRWSARTDSVSSRALLRKSGFTSHQVALLSEDHWYESGRLWIFSDLQPPRFGFSAVAAEWYRRAARQKLPHGC